MNHSSGWSTPLFQEIQLLSRSIHPITREETEEYIRSNLDYSGCGHEIFTSGAVSLIYDFSNGIMRVINHLCSKSLMYAFQQQKHLIDDHMIRFVNDHEMITVGKAVS